ncbi:phage tail protein [Rhizobium sp. S163]|uniref:phage tail protein n=1 Tax=Rhizobium sp. S163 TaxID=3055039 RepID=UPI0025A98218|nr:phage tail protein [Rhizobium sp. S163]MDM9644460.1 phage tail protein [Rhizobium sp. S163]
MNLIVSKIQKSQAKKNSAAVGGVEFEREYGENVSRKVACGLVGIAGHDCYVNTYGSSNKYLEQVYVLSDFPCDGLSRIWAGGAEVPLSVAASDSAKTIYDVPYGPYAGLIRFTFYNGTQVAADVEMINHSNPYGRWTVDHIGTGICWIKAELTYDQEKLGQFPDFFFEFRGARLYDIRKDSTAGGSGPHRWDDYSTYEFAENPVMQEYNYRRGFSVNDDMFCGMGMSPADLPFDRYATAMNICDEDVGGELRYRASVLFDADAQHGDNIEAVMTACGGIVIDDVTGSWPLIGTDQPIVETFTDDDLIQGEAIRFQRRRSMADLVNAVSGTYPEPENMWSPAGYDTQTNAGYVALDRRTRDVNLDFPQVRSKRQANQLASIYFNENRYEATADIVIRPRFQMIKAGDWVRWNSARYGDRVYMVQARSIRALTSDGPRNVSLSLQERDGGIYDSVGVLPPAIPIPNGEPVYLNELQDFSIAPVLGVGADGRSYPAFRVSWSPIEDVTVTGLVLEWWIKTEPANKFSRTIDRASAVAFIQEGILSLTTYQFRHKLIADRSTNWTAAIDVTSLDGGNADLEIGLGEIKDEVLNVFKDLYASLNRNESLLSQIEQNFQITTSVSQSIGRKVSVQGASFNEQIVVLRSDIANVVEQTTELIAAFGENLANGLVAFQAVAAPEGVNVRYAILLKGSMGDTWKESGFFIELYTADGVLKSRAAFDVDQFVLLTSDDENSFPFVVENGELTLNSARIRTIRGGAWISDNNKMQINGIQGAIEIFS